MQIVEVTDFAVRSAVLRLTRPGTPLRFEVFPMIHLAEPAFYAAVTERLGRCDLIVAEGVGGPEPPPPAAEPDLEIASLAWPGLELEDLARRPRRRWDAMSALAASYQIPARFERSGLVEQDIDYERLGVPVLYPDMTDAEFAAGWRRLPAWQRAVVLTAAPLYGLGQAAFASRRSMARNLALDDTDRREHRPAADGSEDVFTLIVDQRDRLLMTALDAVHDTCAGEAITVGVVYGAFHVPAILDGLRSRHGYTARGADWLTVFDLDEPRRRPPGIIGTGSFAYSKDTHRR